MLENWSEASANTVDFAAAIELYVFRGDLSIQGEVSCCSRRSNLEPADEVRTADLTEEVESEINVGQPFTLSMAQVVDTLGTQS